MKRAHGQTVRRKDGRSIQVYPSLQPHSEDMIINRLNVTLPRTTPWYISNFWETDTINPAFLRIKCLQEQLILRLHSLVYCLPTKWIQASWDIPKTKNDTRYTVFSRSIHWVQGQIDKSKGHTSLQVAVVDINKIHTKDFRFSTVQYDTILHIA